MKNTEKIKKKERVDSEAFVEKSLNEKMKIHIPNAKRYRGKCLYIEEIEK